jgi:hypothetical protein
MRKLRAREEAACIALLSGVTQAEAYREAYPTAKNWKPNAVAVKACELFKRPEVKARLEELRATASERNNITVDTLLAELEANRLAALNAPTPQVSAAVAATMGKAKLLGLDKQVINHVGGSGTSQTPTVIELVGGLNITALSDAAMAEILNARDAAMFSKQL